MIRIKVGATLPTLRLGIRIHCIRLNYISLLKIPFEFKPIHDTVSSIGSTDLVINCFIEGLINFFSEALLISVKLKLLNFLFDYFLRKGCQVGL